MGEDPQSAPPGGDTIRCSASLLALALCLATACSSTRIVERWRAPGLKASDLAFEHVAAIAILADAASERIAEEKLATLATRTRVSPGYALMTRDVRSDEARVRAALERQGIDGAIVVRLVGVEDRQTRVDTRVRTGGFYGHYGRGTVVYDPGYYRTDRFVTIETRLYDLTSGEMIWAGVSETFNPTRVEGLIEEVVEAAGRQLAEDGLVP